MNIDLQKQCDLLIENRNIFKTLFKWEPDGMVTAGAAIFTAMGKQAPRERLQQCDQLLKERVGVLSPFRGNVKMPLLCKMALSDNPLTYFETVDKVYQQLKQGALSGGASYSVMAALVIADAMGHHAIETSVARTHEIYAQMKAAHRWLTSGEDLPFAAMLAVTNLDVNVLMEEGERCSGLCKETFHNQNARQSLGHVLALSEAPAAQKSAKVSMIWQGLKASKHKYGSGSEIAILGSLAGLPLSAEEIVRQMVDVDEYLKQQKGFGDFSMGASVRRMMAALMLMNVHRPMDTVATDASVQTALMLVIQMEICMIVMISTTTVISVSSH